MNATTDSRTILERFYRGPYIASVIETASARVGVPCELADNPIDGVTVVTADGRSVVALTEGEKTLLLVALGKAFAELVRLD